MKQLIIILLLRVSTSLFGQSSDSLHINRNSIQFELLGNGILYSINYERIFIAKPTHQFCYRAGISVIPNTLKLNTNWQLGLINELDLLIGQKKRFIEIGSGFTYWNNSYYNRTDGFYIPRLGFRYKFANNKSFIRIGFTPLIYVKIDSRVDLNPKFLPFGGITFGHSL